LGCLKFGGGEKKGGELFAVGFLARDIDHNTVGEGIREGKQDGAQKKGRLMNCVDKPGISPHNWRTFGKLGIAFQAVVCTRRGEKHVVRFEGIKNTANVPRVRQKKKQSKQDKKRLFSTQSPNLS